MWCGTHYCTFEFIIPRLCLTNKRNLFGRTTLDVCPILVSKCLGLGSARSSGEDRLVCDAVGLCLAGRGVAEGPGESCFRSTTSFNAIVDHTFKLRIGSSIHREVLQQTVNQKTSRRKKLNCKPEEICLSVGFQVHPIYWPKYDRHRSLWPHHHLNFWSNFVYTTLYQYLCPDWL